MLLGFGLVILAIICPKLIKGILMLAVGLTLFGLGSII